MNKTQFEIETSKTIDRLCDEIIEGEFVIEGHEGEVSIETTTERRTSLICEIGRLKRIVEAKKNRVNSILMEDPFHAMKAQILAEYAVEEDVSEDRASKDFERMFASQMEDMYRWGIRDINTMKFMLYEKRETPKRTKK